MKPDLAKNEFVAMLAHELRNPLAPILTAIPVLRRAAGENATTDHFCQVIERQVKNLSRIINDLLDASHIMNNGVIPLRNELLNMRSVIENAIEMVLPQIDYKKQRLQIELPPEKMIVVGDACRLEQVFINLVENAMKYTPPAGSISIDANISDASIIIRIKDDGEGINSELLPHIWDAFSQHKMGLDRAQGGLGLGLTIVKKLVELHGGKIRCHSNGPNTGSEFTVTLPTVRAKSMSTIPPYQILVVDDNIDAAESLCAYLQIDGHRVDMVHDGTEAIAMCTTKQYDVVLLDIGLPGLNGYEVCQVLRSHGLKSAIIAITGYGQEEDKKKSHESGFDRHMVKPVDPAHLDEVLLSLRR